MPVPVPPGFDLTNPDIHAERVPLEEYAWLRQTAPVFWNEQTVEDSSFDDGGLWVLSRHEDVKAVSCARTGWSSEENTAIPKFDGKTIGPDTPGSVGSSLGGCSRLGVWPASRMP